MQLLAINSRPAPYRSMARTLSPEQAERQLIGQALRWIREHQPGKPSLNSVGEKLGMTGANYQQYEAAVRKFDDEFVDKALRALGAGRADLAAAKAAVLGQPSPEGPGSRRVWEDRMVVDIFPRQPALNPQGVAEPVRHIDLRQLLGPQTDGLEVAGDSMIPWAEPGEVVLFDRDRYPKRGAGCVIETTDGQLHVKLYEKSDGSTLFAKELWPEERTVQFPLTSVKGVYAVRLRGD